MCARLWIATLFLLLSSAVAPAEPLRVGLSPDYMPIAFKQDGKLLGIEVDNAREVAAILGRDLVFVEMRAADYIEALNTGRVDVIMSGYSITPERADQVAFADPFMEVGQMAIILANNAARFAPPQALYRPGIRIGVETGTTGEAFVRATFPEATVLNYEDPSSAFTALRDGAADVYIHDAPTSWNLASSRENQDMLSLYRPLTREQLAWAVKKGNTRLQNQLNVCLERLRQNGRLGAILNYWIPVTVQVR
jgi:polar amino acid transport system substrate-binding protein